MGTLAIEGEMLPIKIPASTDEQTGGQRQPTYYAGWLLFLDEFNSASVAVQAASYKIVLDRMVGKGHLHKNVAVVCAGNLESDGAIVEQMSTPLQSRLVTWNFRYVRSSGPNGLLPKVSTRGSPASLNSNERCCTRSDQIALTGRIHHQAHLQMRS